MQKYICIIDDLGYTQVRKLPKHPYLRDGMPASRQNILAYLRRKQPASAAEIGRALRMSPANARYHLAVLLNQGSIVIAGERPQLRRGRPTTLYMLATSQAEHNLDRLTSVLLDAWLEGTTPETRLERLQRLAERLIKPSGEASANPTRRLYWAIERLNQMHYRARWEARPSAPDIMLGHCPYAPILPSHPELCQLDAFLIQALTGLPAVLGERQSPLPTGQRECRFHLRRASAE